MRREDRARCRGSLLRCAVGLTLAVAWACSRPETRSASSPAAGAPAEIAPASPPSQSTQPGTGPVEIEMKNVRLHSGRDVILDVRSLRGQMISRTAAQPPIFDDQNSFVIRLFDADVDMDMASLAALMNNHIFAHEAAPLKDLTLGIEGGRLVQKGKMHKGVWVPFTMTATVSAATDGRLKIHMESVDVLGVPTTKLLDLFGLKLDDVVSMKASRGVEVQDDDVFVDVGKAIPPPELRGRLVSVEIVNGKLRQRLTSTDGTTAAALRPARAGVTNYVFFSGSTIRFGKLTMADADLRLIDADQRDPFDFFPDQYVEQLVAGYSKNTRIGGLETFMPDYTKIAKGPKGTDADEAERSRLEHLVPSAALYWPPPTQTRCPRRDPHPDRAVRDNDPACAHRHYARRRRGQWRARLRVLVDHGAPGAAVSVQSGAQSRDGVRGGHP